MCTKEIKEVLKWFGGTMRFSKVHKACESRSKRGIVEKFSNMLKMSESLRELRETCIVSRHVKVEALVVCDDPRRL